MEINCFYIKSIELGNKDAFLFTYGKLVYFFYINFYIGNFANFNSWGCNAQVY